MPGLGVASEELLQLLGLLTAVGAFVVLAPVARIPYPILLVLGGLALSLVPGAAGLRAAARGRADRVPAGRS